jgi:iron-sulfur cluster assembly accessory protein
MGCCNEGGGGSQGGHGHEHGGHSHGGAQAQPSATAVQAPSRFSGTIAVTDKAAEKLCELMVAEKKDPAVYGLRLGVQGGGCSGLTYFMDFDTAKDDDKVFEHKGARVLVDSKSILHVSGSVLDYSEDLQKGGFKVTNPNAVAHCSCGESFAV